MKRLSRLWGSSLLGAVVLLLDQAFAQTELRLVSLGGALTEIVYALGAGPRLVATDTTSVFPPAVQSLPKVGYLRTLGAEGVLALRPDLILASSEAGPQAALQQIASAQVRVETIKAPLSVEGVAVKISAVAKALGMPQQGVVLEQEYRLAWRQVEQEVMRFPSVPRVLFVLAHGGGAALGAGSQTAADAMIRLAGGVNVMAALKGYRPLTAESVLAADPEVILLTTEGEATLGGIDGIWKVPGIAETRAGKARRVVAMEASYLLGFGPRLPQAVAELARRLRNANP